MADNLTTLGLKLPTDPRWVDIAKMNLSDILIDHAFCEQKAASSCISLIVKYPEKTRLIEVVSPVVMEEWEHFERVLKEMKIRGIKLTRARKDEYVAELQKIIIKGGSRDSQLMEDVLICALIEARSAERFKLLYEHISDDRLKEFYHDLMKSEALHYKNFIALANYYNPKEKVQERWQELLHQEAEIMENLKPRSDRFH